MIRLLLPPEELALHEIVIRGDNAHYLSSVLRVHPGDKVTIFDGRGNRYLCGIRRINKKEVIAEKIKVETFSAESPISIILAQGIPKGDKMDFIVQKSTELGVKKIIPLITERSQIRQTTRSTRWKKIAVSASQQSGREKIPEIEDAVAFKEFLTNPYLPLHPPLSKGGQAGGKGIIFSEEEKNKNIEEALKNTEGSTTITLLIGPEGGFSDTETKMAIEKSFIAVSLGPRILRTETAALSAIAIIQHRLGDMHYK